MAEACAIPIVLGATGGFHLFFRAAPSFQRRLFNWILLAAGAGIVLEFLGMLWMFGCLQSVLGNDSADGGLPVSAMPSFLRDMGPGPHFAAAGMLLVGIVAWRVRRGLTTLPASIGESDSATPDTVQRSDVNDAPGRFAWAMLAICAPTAWLLSCVSAVLVGILPLGRVPMNPGIIGGTGFIATQSVLMALPYAFVAVFLMGERRQSQLKSMLSLPRGWFLLLGMGFPVLIHWIPKTLQLLAAWIHWANYESAAEISPVIGEFLEPGRWKWYFLTFLFSALSVEIAWRGYALPRFVSRFGLYRGIVFLGLLWGALHSSRGRLGDDAGVLLGDILGACRGVALSFPTAWLTLRSGSILPAVFLMGLDAILWESALTEPRPFLSARWAVLVSIALWGLLGWLLFNYFAAFRSEDTTAISQAERDAKRSD
jgi:membrane protease YdiL (CAAX protease family)